MANKQTKCLGNCVACNDTDCGCRRKDYNPQWDAQGLDRLLEDLVDGSYTERRKRGGK